MGDLRVVTSLDEGTWRDFVASHPLGNVFHTPEMFQVFAHTQGYRPELWAALDGGALRALFVPVEITLTPFLAGLTRRRVAFGGVLASPDGRGQSALEALLRAYRERAADTALFTELRHLSDTGPLQAVLEGCGFAYEDHLNYLIDLTVPPEVVFQGIGQRTRKSLRHAINRGEVQVEVIERREDLHDWYRLLQATYRRAGVPLVHPSLFQAAFDRLVPQGMARFWLARVGAAPAAASVELLYQGVVYGWYGGTDRAFSAWVPNDLLTWRILEWGAQNGYRMYDFGGAGRSDEKYGVRDFKSKFGGRMVCYGRSTWIHRPRLFGLAQRAYAALRGVRRALSDGK